MAKWNLTCGSVAVSHGHQAADGPLPAFFGRHGEHILHLEHNMTTCAALTWTQFSLRTENVHISLSCHVRVSRCFWVTFPNWRNTFFTSLSVGTSILTWWIQVQSLKKYYNVDRTASVTAGGSIETLQTLWKEDSGERRRRGEIKDSSRKEQQMWRRSDVVRGVRRKKEEEVWRRKVNVN